MTPKLRTALQNLEAICPLTVPTFEWTKIKQAVTRVVDAFIDQETSLSTHSQECWQWHPGCAENLIREIRDLVVNSNGDTLTRIAQRLGVVPITTPEALPPLTTKPSTPEVP